MDLLLLIVILRLTVMLDELDFLKFIVNFLTVISLLFWDQVVCRIFLVVDRVSGPLTPVHVLMVNPHFSRYLLPLQF